MSQRKKNLGLRKTLSGLRKALSQTYVWPGMTKMVVMVALVGGIGLAQAAPLVDTLPSVQASALYSTDTVQQYGSVGTHTSIAFDQGNGTPWISYYDEDNTALLVAHYVGGGGNCGPATDWYCETVDDTASVGTSSSIAVHPDTEPGFLNARQVGVTYYDATHGSLKFSEYSCSYALPFDCTWSTVTIEDADYAGAPSYGQYASLKYKTDGVPQIAYYVSSPFFNEELRYAYRVISGGNCGIGSAANKWHCETVDSGDGMGQYASLGISYTGTPFIAYYDGAADDLRYAYYTGIGNCGTGNAWYCSTVDGIGSFMGRFASIHAPAEVGDKLQFAYYDGSHGVLRYAVAAGGSGNCGPGNSFRCDDIEPVSGGIDKAISLATDSGVPMIAYRWRSSSSEQLKVAQPASALGLDSGNCGPETPIPTWQCTTVDAGSVFKKEAHYVSMAFAPNNLAMIAYSEWDEAYNTYDLKIAYQLAAVYLPMVMK